MQSVPSTHWIYLTSGVLVGGIVIRVIGFYGVHSQHIGMRKFFRMCLWFQSGFAVTAISTAILKLTNVSKFLKHHPKLAFISSVIGLIKFYPSFGPLEEDLLKFHLKKLLPCAAFWFMPSIHFCIFDFDTLELSLFYTLFILTGCFTTGNAIPLKNQILTDVGFKITASSSILFIAGIVYYLTQKQSKAITVSAVINVSLIVLFLGILTDDVQHLKIRYNYDKEATNINPLRKSLPLFLESVIIFGRVAALVTSLNVNDSFKNYD